MNYLFYKTRITAHPPDPGLPAGLDLEIWRPSLGRPRVPGLPAAPFALWSLFHFLRVFATRDYFLVLVRDRGRLVHRTGVFPAHWRFPFMAPRDLQAAGLWTDPAWRGRGLGLAALGAVQRRAECQGRTLWYMVREDNGASIRLAEKAGLLRWGRGGREARPGLLARYRIREWRHAPAESSQRDWDADLKPAPMPPGP